MPVILQHHYGWWGTATSISVAQPRTTSGIDFTLELSGNISGYVYQDDGSTPIANMAVSLLTEPVKRQVGLQ